MVRVSRSFFLVFAPLLLLLVFLSGCGGQNQVASTGELMTKETNYYWDFVGYAPIIYRTGDDYALALLKAKDVAINEAYALAVKTLLGFTVAGGTRVEAYVLQKKISVEFFSQFVRGFQVLEWREDRERFMVVTVVRVYKKDLDEFLGVPVVTPSGVFETLQGED